VQPVTESATDSSTTTTTTTGTPAAAASVPGAYCVYASVAGTAGDENKLALHWIPQSKIGGTTNPAANVIIAPTYTFSPTTTGLDRFQAVLQINYF
jgi:hypothetical protein